MIKVSSCYLIGLASSVYPFKLLENHINRCADSRKIGYWKAVREIDAAIAVGADSSPQLIACKAEALLRLHQIEDSDSCLSNIPKSEQYTPSSQLRYFSIVAEAYALFVQAQVEMALGRFENAVSAAEKARRIDYNNGEIAAVLNNVKMVARARTHGNDLFNAGRYGEALLKDMIKNIQREKRQKRYTKGDENKRSGQKLTQADAKGTSSSRLALRWKKDVFKLVKRN